MNKKANKARYGLSETIGVLIVFCLFLTLAFTSLAFGTVEPWSIAIFNVSTLVLVLLWLIKCTVERQIPLRFPAIALPMVALIGYGALQSISFSDGSGKQWSISMDAEATRLTLEVALCIFIWFLIAVNIFINWESLSWLKNFLIFYGLALAVFGLIQHFTWNGKYYWLIEPSITPSAPFGPFVNHNHFAGYLEMIVPIPLALVLTRAVRGEIALLYGFAAVIMGVATIRSLSRGGMVSLFSGLLFVIVIGLRPSMMRKEISSGLRFPLFLSRVGAVIIIVFAIGLGVLWVGDDSVIKRVEKTDLSSDIRSADSGKETFYQSRGRVWNDTMALIRDNWVMGVGLGAYQTAFTIYNDRDGSLIVAQAHNDYLQILADFGFIGAIAIICFIALIFRDIFRAIRHQDHSMAALALGCGGGVFAMLVHSLFDFNLQLPSNALLYLLLVAVIANISWAAARKNEIPVEQAGRFKGVTRQSEVWS